jgi:hypothetical protein
MAVTIQEALKEGATWDLDGEEELTSWRTSGATIKKFQSAQGIAYEMFSHGHWYCAVHKFHPHEPHHPYWYAGRLPAHLKKPLPTFPRHDPMDDIVSIDDVI